MNMPRTILDEAHIHPAIRQTVATNGADIIRDVQAAIASNDVVVVGMAQNPHPKRARKALDAASISVQIPGIRQLLSEWRRRTARKMLTGWPTLPMVFVRGVLVGGASDLQALIDNGELKKLLP